MAMGTVASKIYNDLHHAIEGLLPPGSPLWKDYCMFQKNFLDQVTQHRAVATAADAPALKRSLDGAAQGRGKVARDELSQPPRSISQNGV